MRIAPVCGAGPLLAVLACSSVPVAPPANLSGTWNFTFSTAAPSGAACTGSMTFTISQTDLTFVGFQRGTGVLSCTGVTLALASPNPSDSTEFDNEMISSGLTSETEVLFDLNTLNGRNSGTLSKDGQMSGTATWQLRVKPHGTLTVTGSWSAVRQ